MNRAILIAGLSYGDEGKGTTIDWLCREEHAKLVVRYNGGCQAGHNVVDDMNRHHTFSQFGSGTFAGASTLLSRHMLVNPVTLVPEAKHLEEIGILKPLSLLHVERDALVTTPYHAAANRLREMDRADGRHGSCGLGIGETVNDWLTQRDEALHVRDTQDLALATSKLRKLRDRMRESTKHIRIATPEMQREADILWKEEIIYRILGYFEHFCDNVQIVGPEWLSKQNGTVLFEGAQGVLLDQDFGFQPHTTWSDCTFGNAHRLLNGFNADVLKLGILRSYTTRHGAGPFVTEDKRFQEWSRTDHNVWTDWQQNFRSGAFDVVATKYALDVIGGVDGLVFTHLDKLDREPIDVCTTYRGTELRVNRPADYAHQETLTKTLLAAKPKYEFIPSVGQTDCFLELVTEHLNVKPWAYSFGPTADHKTRIRAQAPAQVAAS